MKNKLMNYLAGLGIPLCALGAGGCSGICGSCRMSCAPTIFIVLILVCNMLYKRLKVRMGSGHV